MHLLLWISFFNSYGKHGNNYCDVTLYVVVIVILVAINVRVTIVIVIAKYIVMLMFVTAWIW